MPYAQINYPEKQGINGKYTIHDIGCFITAFANLLSLRFGQEINPSQINATFRDRNLYIDVDDRIRDDVDWHFIGFINPAVKVTRTGKGRPSTNKAIVKYVYGGGKTHFCLWDGDGYYIDSWDGQRKPVASYYGEPVAFAEYDVSQPTLATVTPPVNVDYSGKQIFLPSAAGYWRVYKEGGPYVIGSEIGKLWPGNPEWAPGLAYDILGNPQRYVYVIKTEKFDRVAIYGGPDTIAQFRDKPAPQPAPAPVSQPQPAAQLKYTKLEQHLDLIVNKNPTSWWSLGFKDYASAQAAAKLPINTPFRAYGKAQRLDLSDKPVYFMTQEDFGDADVSGKPVNNNGINTLDLTLPAPPPVAPTVPQHAVIPATPETEKIPVTVVPKAPDAWKTTFKVNSAGKYTANTSVVVHDIDEKGRDQRLTRGQLYNIAGTFVKDGVSYYRTKKSVDNNTWYGIPVIALQPSNVDDDAKLLNADFIQSSREALGKLSTKEKIIRVAARHEAKKFHVPSFRHKK